MRRLPTSEEGFGLVELLIAMTVMSIGIFALVAGFSSSAGTLNRASKTATAGVLADKQMEAFRRVGYDSIALDPTILADATYTADGGYDAVWGVSGPCAGSPATPDFFYCSRSRTTVEGGVSYRVDTYVRLRCALPTPLGSDPVTATTCPGSPPNRPAKQISVVVRDPNGMKTLIRETSTFDRSTGS